MKNLLTLFTLLIMSGANIQAKATSIERWEVFEISLKGPVSGNPFLEVELSATFTHKTGSVAVNGFYDGDGVYKIRFMPGETGEWSFTTHSNDGSLRGHSGSFECTPATAENHGPIHITNTFHFKYADGTPYFPIGTTAYVWHLQEDDTLIATTLQTLATSPFNKIRMCVLPDLYRWNMREPRNYPYEGTPPDDWDFTRFNPQYFRELEQNIQALGKLGIQADLILIHPYDYTWGFDEMDQESDLRYLNYLIARVSAFRNVWWSMSNEFDLMENKTEAQWDLYFQHVQKSDPYNHPRSIHNGTDWYDHSKPWVTHLSIQHQHLEEVAEFREKYQKPVLADECGYEGNLPTEWGSLTAREMVHRFWTGYSRGGYVTHGDSYLKNLDPAMEDSAVLFMFHGGTFKGDSVSRIQFLKEIIATFPEDGINPPQKGYWKKRGGSFSEPDFYLYYTGYAQPAYIEVLLPEDHEYKVEIIDTWNMTISTYPQTLSGKCRVSLPGTVGMAVICRRIDD